MRDVMAVLCAMLLAAEPAWAQDGPAVMDFARVWYQQSLLPGVDNAAVVTYYRQVWFTPQTGAMMVYSSSGSGGLRAIGKLDLPWGFSTTGMAGYRVLGMPPAAVANFRHGPEAVLLLNHAIAGPLSLTLRGSYAHLWPATAAAGNEPSGLAMAGLTATCTVSSNVTAAAGVLGQAGFGWQTGLKTLMLGPTLGLLVRF